MLFWANEAEKCIYCYRNDQCYYRENANFVYTIILSTYLSGYKG